MAWVTLQDRLDYSATRTSAALLPVRVSTATHTLTVSLSHCALDAWIHYYTQAHKPYIPHLWFQLYWKEPTSLLFLSSPLLSSSLSLFLSSLPHLFSISCGLDSWRQKSPHPSSFLGVRPPFSTQTNNIACKCLCLLEWTREWENIKTEGKRNRDDGGKNNKNNWDNKRWEEGLFWITKTQNEDMVFLGICAALLTCLIVCVYICVCVSVLYTFLSRPAPKAWLAQCNFMALKAAWNWPCVREVKVQYTKGWIGLKLQTDGWPWFNCIDETKNKQAGINCKQISLFTPYCYQKCTKKSLSVSVQPTTWSVSVIE